METTADDCVAGMVTSAVSAELNHDVNYDCSNSAAAFNLQQAAAGEETTRSHQQISRPTQVDAARIVLASTGKLIIIL